MEKTIVKSSESVLTNYHLVRGMDLNHHGTLFAGKAALLFVETGFIVASQSLHTNEIVCLRIHSLLFKHPIKSGEVIGLKAQLIYAGSTSVGVHVYVFLQSSLQFVFEGFLTFVRADEQTSKPTPHGLVLDLDTDEAKELNRQYLQEKEQ